MIRHAGSLGVMIAAVASIVLASCGSPSTGSISPAPSSASASPTVSASTSGTTGSAAVPTSAPPADGTVIDIRISGGAVTPTNGQADATVDKPIVLRVDSDVADQLHVHSVPEHTFPVEARQGQTFEFTVGVPGRVDVELHDLNRTVVTIQVRP